MGFDIQEETKWDGDKYQNIITFSELDEEIEQFVCHNCENSSEDLEDIAEWSEE